MGLFRKIAFLFLAASILISALAYDRLPEKVATHWGFSGEPDGYSGKLFGAALLPLFLAFLLALFQLLPKLDPLRENYPFFAREYQIFQAAFALFFLGVHSFVLAHALGIQIGISKILAPLFSVLFASLGILLPKTRRNYFVGVRTPWTLESDATWKNANALAGKVFLAFSAAALAGIFSDFLFFLSIVLTIPALAGVLIFSYMEFSRGKTKRASRKG
ncbi:MAG: DUF1648 domain-containing protein [archaeon]